MGDLSPPSPPATLSATGEEKAVPSSHSTPLPPVAAPRPTPRNLDRGPGNLERPGFARGAIGRLPLSRRNNWASVSVSLGRWRAALWPSGLHRPDAEILARGHARPRSWRQAYGSPPSIPPPAMPSDASAFRPGTKTKAGRPGGSRRKVFGKTRECKRQKQNAKKKNVGFLPCSADEPRRPPRNLLHRETDYRAASPKGIERP